MGLMHEPHKFRLKPSKTTPLFRIAIPSWRVEKQAPSPTQVTPEKVTRDEIATLFEDELHQPEDCASCNWLSGFMRPR